MLSQRLPWEGSTMKKRSAGLLATALLLAGAVTSVAPAVAQANKESASMPKVGDVAPDFTLKFFDGNDLKDVKLSDYRGKKNVVLAFYIFAFTGG
jgi:cytochrome oxidase Cu insertion factor (SCO1/SenC/PrrC family)